MKVGLVILSLFLSIKCFSSDHQYINFYVETEHGKYVTNIGRWSNKLISNYSQLQKETFRVYVDSLQPGAKMGPVGVKLLIDDKEVAEKVLNNFKKRGYLVVSGDYFKDAMEIFDCKGKTVYQFIMFRDVDNKKHEYSKVYSLDYKKYPMLVGNINLGSLFEKSVSELIIKGQKDLRVDRHYIKVLKFDTKSRIQREVKGLPKLYKESAFCNKIFEESLKVVEKAYQEEKQRRLTWFAKHVEFLKKSSSKKKKKDINKGIDDIYD